MREELLSNCTLIRRQKQLRTLEHCALGKKEEWEMEKNFIIKVVFFIELFPVLWLREVISLLAMEQGVNQYTEEPSETKISLLNIWIEVIYQWQMLDQTLMGLNSFWRLQSAHGWMVNILFLEELLKASKFLINLKDRALKVVELNKDALLVTVVNFEKCMCAILYMSYF